MDNFQILHSWPAFNIKLRHSVMSTPFKIDEDGAVFLGGARLGRHSGGQEGAQKALSRRGARVLFTSTQGRAAKRLRGVAALLQWRAAHGVCSEPAGAVEVVANALSVLGGTGNWRADIATGCKYLVCLEGDVGPLLAAALGRAARPGQLLSDGEAGRLLGLVLMELCELRATGAVLEAHPVDETPAARASRRAAMKRSAAALRAKNYRVRRKQRKEGHLKVTNGVTPVIPTGKRDASSVTFRPGSGCGLVAAAVAAGEATPLDIANLTGLNPSTVKVALHRLAKSGVITRAGRGLYVPKLEGGVR